MSETEKNFDTFLMESVAEGLKEVLGEARAVLKL